MGINEIQQWPQKLVWPQVGRGLWTLQLFSSWWWRLNVIGGFEDGFSSHLTLTEGVWPLENTLLAALSQADGCNKFPFGQTMHLPSNLVIHQRLLVAAISARVSLLSVHVSSADPKSPHQCCIVPLLSRKTWQELHQAHHAKLCQHSSSSSSSSSFSFSSSQSFSSRTPYEIFMQCNESIIKMKQLLNGAGRVCFSLNDTALLNLPCHCKKDTTEFKKSFPHWKSTTSAASKSLGNCSNFCWH